MFVHEIEADKLPPGNDIDNKRLVVHAAGQAEKAAKYILEKKYIQTLSV